MAQVWRRGLDIPLLFVCFVVVCANVCGEPTFEPYRWMNRGDIPTLLRLDSEAYRDRSWTEESFVSQLANIRGAGYVYERHGKVVGYVTYQYSEHAIYVSRLSGVLAADTKLILDELKKKLLPPWQPSPTGRHRTVLVILDSAVNTQNEPILLAEGFQRMVPGRFPLARAGGAKFAYDILREHRLHQWALAIQQNHRASNYYERLAIEPNSGVGVLEDLAQVLKTDFVLEIPEIVEASAVILDPQKRAAYDEAQTHAEWVTPRVAVEPLGEAQAEAADYYSRLGCSSNSDRSQIVDAYISAVQKYAAEAFRDQPKLLERVHEAFAILTSPSAKHFYDAVRSGGIEVNDEVVRRLLAKVQADRERAKRNRIELQEQPQVAKPFVEDIDPMNLNLYRRLGVPQNASHELVFSQYQRLKADRSKLGLSSEQWAHIQEAFWVLAEPGRAAQYTKFLIDRELEREGFEDREENSLSDPRWFLQSLGRKSHHTSLEHEFPGTLWMAQPEAQDLYRRLGVPRNASLDVLKTTVDRVLASASGWTPSLLARIQEAAFVLLEPRAREHYDDYFPGASRYTKDQAIQEAVKIATSIRDNREWREGLGELAALANRAEWAEAVRQKLGRLKSSLEIETLERLLDQWEDRLEANPPRLLKEIGEALEITRHLGQIQTFDEEPESLDRYRQRLGYALDMLEILRREREDFLEREEAAMHLEVLARPSKLQVLKASAKKVYESKAVQAVLKACGLVRRS